MTDLERDPTTVDPEASKIEGGGTEQTWGQGEGKHEPTIPDEGDEAAEDVEEIPPTYTAGTPASLDDPDLPLTREDEGMER
jgi:hypothetical protein